MAAKRARTQLPEAVHEFILHTGQKWGYEPTRIQLHADYRVQTFQGLTAWPVHGDWSFDEQTDTFRILFNWQGNNMKAKRHEYTRIEGTQCFELINFPSEWSSMLLPYTG